MLLSHQLDEVRAIGLAGPFGNETLRIHGMKFYADGSLIGGTAAFSEPYGENREFIGSTYWTADRLAALVREAHEAGWQVGIHTQGDRAMQMSLDAIEGALRVKPMDDARPRLEHAGYPTPEQVVRIRDLGVITVDQPSYLYDSGDEFLKRLGDRAHRLQPLREELDAGVHVVLSSDAFVASYRPLDTIAAAVERRTREGALTAAKSEFRERTGGGVGGSTWVPPLLPRDFVPPVDLAWPEYVETARGREWHLPTPVTWGDPL